MRTEHEHSLAAFVEKLQGPTPLLLFAGAGLSQPYPSCLPLAWSVVRATASYIQPSIAPEGELNDICQMPAEVFFETIDDFIHRDLPELHEGIAFSPWLVLRNPNLAPNAAHYMFIYLAAQWKTPILTVNFDQLLERAARRVGLEPVVCFEQKNREHVWRQQLQHGEIAIWKLHGDIENLNIAVTTRKTGSQRTTLLTALRRLFEMHQSCLVGYSGRDLDIFPHVLTFTLPAHGFWIDKCDWRQNFGMRLAANRFIRIQADVQDLAFDFFQQPTMNRLFEACRTRVERIRALQSVDERDAQRESYSSVGVNCRRLQEYFTSKKRREALWSLLLSKIGKYQKARPYAQRVLSMTGSSDPVALWQAHMVMAGVHHGLSQYVSQQKHAEIASQVAAKHGLKSCEAQSLYDVTGALQMQYIPNLGFDHRGRHLQLIDKLHFASRIGRHLGRMVWLTFPWPKSTCEDLDRVIAYVQLLERLVTLWPGNRSFQGKISKFGARGFADLEAAGSFYFKRRTSDPSLALGAVVGDILIEQTAAELMGNKLRLAQIMIGQAQVLMSVLKVEASIEKFGLAQCLAVEIGNPYTILKALIGKRQAAGIVADPEFVRKCLQEIEGLIFERMHTQILNYLSDASSCIKDT
jgi:hypothetical protein